MPGQSPSYHWLRTAQRSSTRSERPSGEISRSPFRFKSRNLLCRLRVTIHLQMWPVLWSTVGPAPFTKLKPWDAVKVKNTRVMIYPIYFLHVQCNIKYWQYFWMDCLMPVYTVKSHVPHFSCGTEFKLSIFSDHIIFLSELAISSIHTHRWTEWQAWTC